MSRKCKSCQFALETQLRRVYTSDTGKYFTCRRYPPNGSVDDETSERMWPAVSGEHWCGEFKKRDWREARDER